MKSTTRWLTEMANTVFCRHDYRIDASKYDGDPQGWIWEVHSASYVCLKCGKEREISVAMERKP